MDALKRAEKARQAQAEKRAEGKGTSKSTLTLDPIDVEEPGREKAPERLSEPPPASPTPEPHADESGPTPTDPPSAPAPNPATTHFSLSDEFPATEKVPPPGPAEGQGEGEKLGPFSLVRDNELSLEDTGEMLPVVREAEKSLNDYFDDPDAAAPTPGGPADTVGDDDSTVLGGRSAQESDTHAKRAAQSMFRAKAPAVARYQRNRTLIIALPLLLLGVIGIGVLLFWDQLERTFFGAPPVLVQRPPRATELAPPPEPAAAVEASRLAAAAEAAALGQPAARVEPNPEAAETTRVASGTAAPNTDSIPESSGADASAAGTVAGTGLTAPTTGNFEGVAGEPSRDTSPAPRPAVTRPPIAAVGRPYAGAAGGGIRISRRSDPDKVHAGIYEAYLAFQRGDDATARALYAEVNRQHPKNRNALLGLGAIAVRGGNYGEAVGHYARLLSVNPRDPIARAALINLNQRVSPGEGESHVKRMLAEDPDQPFLYFTLGNLYARQGRWFEAQQAYFDAYRLDTSSADFAFNLAVSLDRLGQPATALTYYHRALELAANGVASFEPRAVRLRIDRLRGGGQG